MASSAPATGPAPEAPVHKRHARVLLAAGILLALFAASAVWWAHKRGWFAASWYALLFSGFLLLLVLAVLVLWRVPQWQVAGVTGLEPKDRFDRQNEARKTLTTILGGALLLTGGFFTWKTIRVQQDSAENTRKFSEENLKIAKQNLEESRATASQNQQNAKDALEQSKKSSEQAQQNAQDSLKASQKSSEETLSLAHEGQFADRFAKAVEQLGALDAGGNPKLEVRLGGIYSLEAIANKSEQLHWPIMEALCSYVRLNAPHQREEAASKSKSDGEQKSPTKSTPEQQPHPRVDIQAVLTVLGRREHQDDWESRGRLDLRTNQRLDLSGTDLRGADLNHANLDGAVFIHADLREARLFVAYLSGADLSRADLRGAPDLVQEQLDSAEGDKETKLPADLCLPRDWPFVEAEDTPNVCPPE